MAKRFYFTAENEDNEIWEHCGNIRGAKTIGKKLANEYNQTIYINDVDGEEIVEVIEPDEVVDIIEPDNISEEAEDSKEGDNNTMETKEFLQKYGTNLYRGYWCGGGDGNYKQRKSTTDPKALDHALNNFVWLLGALKDNVIIVDFDDPEAFECALKIAKANNEHCVVIKSSKGGHFYYYDTNHVIMKSNTKNKTLLTLSPVDYKLGYKIIASTGEIKQADNYACLSKEDKTLREVVYYNFKDGGTLDEIPYYHQRVNSSEKYNFLNMAEGDGRNDLFHSYMIPVKNSGFTYEQYSEAMQLVNKFLLKDSISGDEFETVIRQEEWNKIRHDRTSEFIIKDKFLHDKFAEYIKQKYHIKKINGQLHIYDNGAYVPGYQPIEKAMIKEIKSLTDRRRKEVLKYLDLICDNLPLANLNLILFKNGIFNIETFELLPHSPEYAITNMIPWEYNQPVRCEMVDKVLDNLSCNNSQIRSLLEEIGGFCLYRDNRIFKKAILLKGDKNNGKSTFITLLYAMLGHENVSTLDFKQLDSRFKTAQLFGKLANLGDDISDCYKDDPSVFKKIVSGDSLNVEEKGTTPFDFMPYAKLIFSANKIPRIKDDTGAAAERFIIVPLERTFTSDDPDFDPTLHFKLQQKEAVEYFIQLSLNGLKRVLDNKKFTITQKIKEELEEYKQQNNPILSFIEECKNDNGVIENIYNEPVNEVFERYDGFCFSNGFKKMSKIEFARQINNILKTKSSQKKIKKKNVKVFEKVAVD